MVIKSQLSDLFNIIGQKNKWVWSDSHHTYGHGNPTLSDEMYVMKRQSYKLEASYGEHPSPPLRSLSLIHI